MSGPDPNALAIEYLLATRTGATDADELAARLAGLPERELTDGLAADSERIAFWLDVYNAAVVRAGAVDLTDRRTRWRHFRRPTVTIAGQRLSLDAVEHGLLRRSRWKLGLGYLGNPLPSRFERSQRVDQPDPRVHFALNCGATSCPPIAAYEPARLEEQLAIATSSYLAAEVERDGEVLRVPAVLLWYIGDFGGRRGIRRLLHEAGIDGTDRPLRARAWDWTPAPDRWMGDPG